MLASFHEVRARWLAGIPGPGPFIFFYQREATRVFDISNMLLVPYVASNI